MMKRLKRLLSLCLTLAIILGSVFSTNAFAATPYLKSDTPTKMTIKQPYTFKFTVTGVNTPITFTTGNCNTIKIVSCTKSGNAYYVKVSPVAYSASTGLYSTMKGQKPELQCVITSAALNGTGKVSVVEAYGGAITATWVDGRIVSEIAHTCVGDVDIVTAQGDGNYASMLVGKLFRKSHPEWEVSESSNGCHYVRPENDMESTFEDVEEFCSGNPKNIAKMSQKQLYELSAIIRDMGGLDIAPYKTEFKRNWNSKMAWVFADTSQY